MFSSCSWKSWWTIVQWTPSDTTLATGNSLYSRSMSCSCIGSSKSRASSSVADLFRQDQTYQNCHTLYCAKHRCRDRNTFLRPRADHKGVPRQETIININTKSCITGRFVHSHKKRYKSCHWGCTFWKGTLLYPKAAYWYLSGTY